MDDPLGGICPLEQIDDIQFLKRTRLSALQLCIGEAFGTSKVLAGKVGDQIVRREQILL